MMNAFFPDEEISKNDLYYICYMIERVARRLKQKKRYIVNAVIKEEWRCLISLANLLHYENPLKVEEEWIEEYKLKQGDFDVTKVDSNLVASTPTSTQIGKVYMRLILDAL